MKPSILTLLALALAPCACADPECGPDHRKIAKVCVPIRDAEGPQLSTEAGLSDGNSSANSQPLEAGAVADSAPPGAEATNGSSASPDAGRADTPTVPAPDAGDTAFDGGDTIANAEASAQATCVKGTPDGGGCPTINCHTATCGAAGTCEYAANPGASCGNNLQCDSKGDCVRKPAMCGNGMVEAGEQCDDGNTVESDDCVGCQDAFCGDGYVRGLEECDPIAPGWTGKCNDICKRTVYELCNPANSPACRADDGTMILCGALGHCVPLCGSEALTCPLVPGFDVECAGYTCFIRCSAGGQCPSKMHCAEGNLCATETAQEL